MIRSRITMCECFFEPLLCTWLRPSSSASALAARVVASAGRSANTFGVYLPRLTAAEVLNEVLELPAHGSVAPRPQTCHAVCVRVLCLCVRVCVCLTLMRGGAHANDDGAGGFAFFSLFRTAHLQAERTHALALARERMQTERQLLTVDLLACGSMKNAANCDT